MYLNIYLQIYTHRCVTGLDQNPIRSIRRAIRLPLCVHRPIASKRTHTHTHRHAHTNRAKLYEKTIYLNA